MFLVEQSVDALVWRSPFSCRLDPVDLAHALAYAGERRIIDAGLPGHRHRAGKILARDGRGAAEHFFEGRPELWITALAKHVEEDQRHPGKLSVRVPDFPEQIEIHARRLQLLEIAETAVDQVLVLTQSLRRAPEPRGPAWRIFFEPAAR